MKVCGTCKTRKELTHFCKKSRNKDGLANTCRDCNKKRCAEYYRNNREKHCAYVAEKRRSHKHELRELVWNYYLEHPCIDCGITDPIVLEFDHTRDKVMTVSEMVQKGYSKQRILGEISKCAVRCANCHRRKTAKDGGWYAEIAWS